MKITVEFDSLEEFKAYFKNKRDAKEADIDPPIPQAQPIQQAQQVQQAQQGFTGFQPQPQASAAPAAAPAVQQGFPQGQPQPQQNAAVVARQEPATAPLVSAIVGKIQDALSKGQPEAGIVQWFQSLFPEAGQASLQQILGFILPRATEVQLNHILRQLGG